MGNRWTHRFSDAQSAGGDADAVAGMAFSLYGHDARPLVVTTF